MSFILDLIALVEKEDYVYIQTHDYPDHDTVASAFALQKLLKSRGITGYLVYEGKIRNDSLLRMIEHLSIKIRPAKKEPLRTIDKIIIVDGCKGSKNVTDLTGDEIAVIDHHEGSSPEEILLSDIHPDYGACSSIIFSYYENLGIEPAKDVATALIIGLLSDTALMTKGVAEADMLTYNSLYNKSDHRLVNSILKTKIQKKDLSFYREAIDRVRIQDELAFCYFPEGCNENLLGVIGDFFLSLREVAFVFLCARNNGKINFALRSEEDKWNAADIIRKILDGTGYGGGHSDIAGGIMNDPSNFDEESLLKRILQLLKEASSRKK